MSPRRKACAVPACSPPACRPDRKRGQHRGAHHLVELGHPVAQGERRQRGTAPTSAQPVIRWGRVRAAAARPARRQQAAERRRSRHARASPANSRKKPVARGSGYERRQLRQRPPQTRADLRARRHQPAHGGQRGEQRRQAEPPGRRQRAGALARRRRRLLILDFAHGCHGSPPRPGRKAAPAPEPNCRRPKPSAVTELCRDLRDGPSAGAGRLPRRSCRRSRWTQHQHGDAAAPGAQAAGPAPGRGCAAVLASGGPSRPGPRARAAGRCASSPTRDSWKSRCGSCRAGGATALYLTRDRRHPGPGPARAQSRRSVGDAASREGARSSRPATELLARRQQLPGR